MVSREIIRVFIASPSDVGAERSIVQEAVHEIDRTVARHTGHSFELLRWEDRSPTFGRPQSAINFDVDNCDLFIGLLWKRWGTPPDADTQYQSGFEEEFDRAVNRKNGSGSPEISLFFKRVPESDVADPGPQLVRSQEFRQQVIVNRIALFREFNHSGDLASMVRECLTEFIYRSGTNRHHGIDRQETHTIVASDSQSPSAIKGVERHNTIKPIIEEIIRYQITEAQDPFDIARLRLCANLTGAKRNDEQRLDAHDCNLVYESHRDGTVLQPQEVQTLLQLAYGNLSNENTPFWTWFQLCEEIERGSAIRASITEDSEENRAGAIRAMQCMRMNPSEYGHSRSQVLTTWLRTPGTHVLRNAAFAYMKDNAEPEDIELIQREVDKGDSSTYQEARECLIRLQARSQKPSESLDTVLDSMALRINTSIIASVAPIMLSDPLIC
ncbi:MAG: DUF4062 domain-containing protein [Planctomycetota bacterium]